MTLEKTYLTAKYLIDSGEITQEIFRDIMETEVVAVDHAHKVRAHSQGGGTHWVICSNCEKPIDWEDSYCKHCGAIMDEELAFHET